MRDLRAFSETLEVPEEVLLLNFLVLLDFLFLRHVLFYVLRYCTERQGHRE